MSIIKALRKIENEKLTSFHVPGHKNGRLLKALPFASNIGCFDTTEIPGTDNLHAPEAAIQKLEEAISRYYQTQESHLLVNGTTSGIISMIYAVFKPGDKVIISRDAHKSVFTAMILARLRPIYIMPEVDEDLGLSLGLTEEAVKQVFEAHDDVAGLIVTYPNYHGICTDLKAIAEIVHSQEAVLLVDGAHGAHLNLSSDLPSTAIASGADVVVHSTHKSLPAFTQSSLLHIISNRISVARVRMALSMFQSSSPSYLLMASLENAIDVARDDGIALMKVLLAQVEDFKDRLSSNTCFELLTSEMLPKKMTLDMTKLTLLLKGSAISGGVLERRLREEYGIQCEYGTDSMVLFITSIATLEHDFESLYGALYEISQEIGPASANRRKPSQYQFKKFSLECGIMPSEAVHQDLIKVDLEQAIGECAGEFIVPYPPGVPIVVPGERISKQVVNYIEEGCRKGYNINGVYPQKTLQVNIIKKVTT